MRVLISTLLLLILFLLDEGSHIVAQEATDSIELPITVDSLVIPDTVSTIKLVEVADSLPSKKDKKREKTKYYNPNHSPKKAAFLSLALPGTGQIYNRKYWKLPIVYGGMGASLYFLVKNAQALKTNNKLLSDAYAVNASNISLIQSNRDITLRNVEVSGIVFGVLYLVNILDAIVDAHLLNFDVSDDLSVQINPHILTVNNEVIPTLGLNLRL